MALTQELRQQHHDLWHRMVTHPFVIELGEGTLAMEKFRAYFLQDYVFVRDLVTMTALGLAKAPTFLAANTLNQFLSGVLNPENDLFVRAFTALGVSAQESMAASASPITQAFGDFLVRTALEGSFEDIVTVLYVTEGTYLDWGTRLLEAGKHPSQPLYQEWITIHGPQVLGAFVAWLGQHLDSAVLASQHPRLKRIFHTALRYEYLFWEEAYYGGTHWPDQTTG
jgi:thiaminase (transcriptional activator TenA)